MTAYTCPMHPEVRSEQPGSCPICGMKLVMAKDVKQAVSEDKGLGPLTWKSYLPLITVVSVILLTTVVLTVRDAGLGAWSVSHSISYFMIGFFLAFSTFKLMDLNGFADGYQTYDLLAMKVPAYGYWYPFIELFFGLAMILVPTSPHLLLAEFGLMLFSGIGVAIKIAKKEPFMCACLGTFLKVPLTKITLIEDFGMAGLALLMLFLR